jgi:ribosome-associated heat shock protein Hsp15
MRRKPTADPPPTTDDEGRVRLDQWLWAARFFKTRSLAAEAIEGGKVQLNDERAKRAKLVRAGDRVRVRLGPYEHLVTVRGVALRRGPASVAAELYEETSESREARERLATQLKSVAPLFHYDKGRPTKKDRREIERLRGREPDDG